MKQFRHLSAPSSWPRIVILPSLMQLDVRRIAAELCFVAEFVQEFSCIGFVLSLLRLRHFAAPSSDPSGIGWLFGPFIDCHKLCKIFGVFPGGPNERLCSASRADANL